MTFEYGLILFSFSHFSEKINDMISDSFRGVFILICVSSTGGVITILSETFFDKAVVVSAALTMSYIAIAASRNASSMTPIFNVFIFPFLLLLRSEGMGKPS